MKDRPDPVGNHRHSRANGSPKSEFQINKKKKTPLALRQQDHFVIGAFGRILRG